DAAIEAPSLPSGTFLKALAVTNDDRALVTTGRSESEGSPLYLYSGRQRTLAQLDVAMNNATPAAAGAGSSVVFIQGTPATTSAPVVILFNVTNAQFDPTSAALTQNAVPPVADRTGSRAILNGTNVYGVGFALFGTFPSTSVAATLKPDGTRAYTYDPDAGGLLVFDVSATQNG